MEAIQFGWTVDYFGIGDLVQVIDRVSDEEVDQLFEEYKGIPSTMVIMKKRHGRNM